MRLCLVERSLLRAVQQ